MATQQQYMSYKWHNLKFFTYIEAYIDELLQSRSMDVKTFLSHGGNSSVQANSKPAFCQENGMVDSHHKDQMRIAFLCDDVIVQSSKSLKNGNDSVILEPRGNHFRKINVPACS